ncbi:MAG: hypothetical protein DRH17_00240 [Deltaproteobacteria bacterium]|nr:MAG: hypothetical protein DRH17_00240 [Deltaproteobacteria bacterium]
MFWTPSWQVVTPKKEHNPGLQPSGNYPALSKRKRGVISKRVFAMKRTHIYERIGEKHIFATRAATAKLLYS